MITLICALKEADMVFNRFINVCFFMSIYIFVPLQCTIIYMTNLQMSKTKLGMSVDNEENEWNEYTYCCRKLSKF